MQEFHRLHVGDVIKFGESTRLYALEGPEELRPAEYESDNLVRVVRKHGAMRRGASRFSFRWADLEDPVGASAASRVAVPIRVLGIRSIVEKYHGRLSDTTVLFVVVEQSSFRNRMS